MTALSLTYNLTNGTAADADKVQQDLVDIRDYANNSVVRIDGTNAMTAALSLSGDPSATNHAVRRAYMNGAYVFAKTGTSQSYTANVATTTILTTEDHDSTDSGTAATNYNLATGVFTAPIAGVYMVTVSWTFLNTDAHTVVGKLAYGSSSVTLFRCQPSSTFTSLSGDPVVTNSIPVKVAAAETITPSITTVGNGSPVSRTYGNFVSIAWLHG